MYKPSHNSSHSPSQLAPCNRIINFVMMKAPDAGLTGNIVGVSGALSMTMAAFAGVAVFNCIELLYIIFSTFKRRSGLYFWSLLLATVGTPPYVLGFMFKFFGVAAPGRDVLITMVFVITGWCLMVTGQSMVLYSRLHLVVRCQNKLRCVLGMIIFDALVCHIPIAVMSLGANSYEPDIWIQPYSIFTNVQITIFFVQESIISCVYVWATSQIFRQRSDVCFDQTKDNHSSTTRKVLLHLIAMNVVIIVMNIALLVIQYTGNFALHTVFKAMIYSIKLKMEFRILNQLIDLTHSSRSGSGASDLNHHSFQLGPVKTSSAHGMTAEISHDQETYNFGNNAFAGRRGGGEATATDPGKNQIMVVLEMSIHNAGAEPLEAKKPGEGASSRIRSSQRDSGDSSEVEFIGRGY